MPIHDWSRVPAGIFHDFHITWTAEIKRALNAGLLPADYYALAEQWAGDIAPDVLTLHGPGAPEGGATTAQGPTPSGGGVAVAERPPRTWFHAKGDESARYAQKARRIAVRHVSNDDLVAAIELISPGNKAGRIAIRQFVQKARDLIATGVHLMVVDLFPPTPRDPDGIHDLIWGDEGEPTPPRPAGRDRTVVSYLADVPPEAYVEPLPVGEPLPDMPLFLTPDLYVPTPLESTYVSAWESLPARYRRELSA